MKTSHVPGIESRRRMPYEELVATYVRFYYLEVKFMRLQEQHANTINRESFAKKCSRILRILVYLRTFSCTSFSNNT